MNNQPKILSYVILHHGRPYLAAALESIYDQVDKIVILYTDFPSQGYAANIPCPDTRAELMAEAKPFMDKIIWVDGRWAHEGEHTNAVWKYAKGYDWIWRFDADEVSPPGMVAEMIRQAEETKHKNYCVPFLHYWRCFHKVCRDSQMPVRLMRVWGGDPVNFPGERYLDSKDGKWNVLHFGYAQPTKYIVYKMQVSGHRPEFRPTWFQDRWMANAQKDVHIVCFPDFWNPVDFDKTTMPEVLKRHKYFNAEVIDG